MNQSDVLASLEAHMEQDLPNECVGLLLLDGNTIQLRNQARSPHRFFVNPVQYDDIELTAPVCALYHSHPLRPAKPSGEDERMMMEWPEVMHIILSPDGHKAYHVVNEDIHEIDLPW